MQASSENKKVWHLVALKTSRRAEEFSGSLMFDLGATGLVTLEEDEASVKLGAYFDERDDVEEIKQTIETEFIRAGLAHDLLEISVSDIPDQDWMQKWKEGFEPLEVGDRLIIAPSWKLPERTEGRVVIQIDPGMAFGTGTHETTQLCLEAIERRWRGGKLLDVGTGTGILAIAAALLQPESIVTAIDNDPLAVEVASENIETNGASTSVKVIEGEPRDFAGQRFDMVVANLTAEVIVNLMDDLLGCLAPSGLVIFSGILTELLAGVEQRATAAGLNIIEQRSSGEWSALVGRMGDV